MGLLINFSTSCTWDCGCLTSFKFGKLALDQSKALRALLLLMLLRLSCVKLVVNQIYYTILILCQVSQCLLYETTALYAFILDGAIMLQISCTKAESVLAFYYRRSNLVLPVTAQDTSNRPERHFNWIIPRCKCAKRASNVGSC
jgi:hypothetical protein